MSFVGYYDRGRRENEKTHEEREREREETEGKKKSEKKMFALQEDHPDGPQLDSIIWVLFTLVPGPSAVNWV